MKIVIPITLTPKQREIDSHPARFKIIRAGRRFGKTWLAAYWLLRHALTKPGNYWYCGKVLSLVRDEFWPTLLRLAPRECMYRKPDERFFKLYLKVGNSYSIISCVSAEKEDNLRGRGLSGLVVDEAAFLKPSVWGYVLRPMLLHSRGPALLISSPKPGWFTRQYAEAERGNLPDWAAFHGTVYDNPTIQKDEIEEIRKTTPETVWQQEYMAQLVDSSGVVYPMFSETSIFDPHSKFREHKSWPTVRGLDWGFADSTACSWLHVAPNGHVIVSEEHIQGGWEVEKHVGVIEIRSRGMNIVSGATVLDRTAFRQTGDTRDSIADKFARNGIHCAKSEKDLSSSIDTVARFLRGDDDGPWLHISAKCEKTIRAFQDWEHKDHEPDILAALRYGLVFLCQRRMTKLADLIPVRKTNDAPQIRPADAHEIRLPLRKSKRTSWAWDFEAGRPI